MRRIAILFLALFVCGASLVFALPYLISKDQLAKKMSQQFETSFGQPLSFDKEIEVEYLPALKLTAFDIDFSLPVDDDAASVKAAAATVELGYWAALFGGADIRKIALRNPTIHLPSQSLNTLPEWFNEVAEGNDSIPQIEIINGNLSWQSGLRGQRPVMANDIELNLSQSDASRLSVFGTISLMGEKMTLDASLRPQATQASQLNVDLTAKGELFSLDMVGALEPENLDMPLPSFSGEVNFETPSLATFSKWLDGRVEINGEQTSVRLQGALTVSKSVYSFKDLTLAVNDQVAIGGLQLAFRDGQRDVSGTLAFESLDLDPLLPDVSKPGASRDVTLGALASFGGARVKQLTQNDLDLSYLDQFNIDLRLSAQVAQLSGFDFTNAAGVLSVADGQASLQVASANWQDVLIRAAASLAHSPGNDPKISWTFNLENVDHEKLLAALPEMPQILKGKGSVEVTAGTSLGSDQPFLGLNIKAKQGALSIIDLAAAVDSRNQADQANADVQRFAPNQASSMPFDTLSVDLTHMSGALAITELEVKSGESVFNLEGRLSSSRELEMRGFFNDGGSMAYQETSAEPQPNAAAALDKAVAAGSQAAKKDEIDILIPDFILSGSLDAPVLEWTKPPRGN